MHSGNVGSVLSLNCVSSHLDVEKCFVKHHRDTLGKVVLQKLDLAVRTENVQLYCQTFCSRKLHVTVHKFIGIVLFSH